MCVHESQAPDLSRHVFQIQTKQPRVSLCYQLSDPGPRHTCPNHPRARYLATGSLRAPVYWNYSNQSILRLLNLFHQFLPKKTITKALTHSALPPFCLLCRPLILGRGGASFPLGNCKQQPIFKYQLSPGNSLLVQCLRRHASTDGDLGSTSGQRAKISRSHKLHGVAKKPTNCTV